MVYACACMGRGHTTDVSKLHALRPYCVLASLEADVGEFTRQCLYFVRFKAGDLRPRLLGELVHGDGLDGIFHVDFLYIGAGGSFGKTGFSKVPSKYPLVLFEDVSSYVWLEPAAAYTAALKAVPSLA